MLNFFERLALNLFWPLFALSLNAAGFGGVEVILIAMIATVALGLIAAFAAVIADGPAGAFALAELLESKIGGTKCLPGTIGFYAVAIATAVSPASLTLTILWSVIGIAAMLLGQKKIDSAL